MLTDPLILDCYINTYHEFNSGVTHPTKAMADEKALPHRIACIHIRQYYYAGDGLPYDGRLDSDDDIW